MTIFTWGSVLDGWLVLAVPLHLNGVFCESGWQFLAHGFFHCFLLCLCYFISFSCTTDVIHSKTVFSSSSRVTNIFFSFIITNCFKNCYTVFSWLPVSNILDFKFYCNRIVLLWKWSQVKDTEILVHNVFKSWIINFPSKWSFWLFYS